MTFPPEFRKDIETAISILKEEGCTEVYLFGSLADGLPVHRRTDIDIAVRGLDTGRYFEVFGRILSTLDHSMDLVDLDRETPFTRALLEKGIVHRVA